MTDAAAISIPADLLPRDGRFGSGPSKVRPEQLEHLASLGRTVLGTSHRQAPVKNLVGAVREGLAELFSLPDGYEIILGNGGVDRVLGHRGVRPGPRARPAPVLRRVLRQVRAASPRTRRSSGDSDRHQGRAGHADHAAAPRPASTSTPGRTTRPRPASWPRSSASRAPTRTRSCSSTPPPAPAACRSTSTEVDVYYFAPQKCFASDGGLWLAAFSPAALARVDEIAASGRWVPDFFSLPTAIDNSRLNQTYNTPALATLVLLADQIDWINGQGGLDWAVERTADSLRAAVRLGRGDVVHARRSSPTRPHRSQVVGTIDFDDAVDAAAVAKVAARQRRRRRRALPQARPQPAARGDVPGGRPRRRVGADRLHRARRRAAPRLSPPSARHAHRRR